MRNFDAINAHGSCIYSLGGLVVVEGRSWPPNSASGRCDCPLSEFGTCPRLIAKSTNGAHPNGRRRSAYDIGISPDIHTATRAQQEGGIYSAASCIPPPRSRPRGMGIRRPLGISEVYT